MGKPKENTLSMTEALIVGGNDINCASDMLADGTIVDSKPIYSSKYSEQNQGVDEEELRMGKPKDDSLTMLEALMIEAIKHGKTWDDFKGLFPMFENDAIKEHFEAMEKEQKTI